MWLKETKSKCCEEFEPLPTHVNCFIPDICCKLNQLICRHKRAFIKNKRILQLAEPSKRNCRYAPKCPCKFKKPIEIIHLDQVQHTRTEQLAYPPARRLLLFKKEIRELFEPYRIVMLNRLIRKSLLSVYSRLGNVQPPAPEKKIPKWDKMEWVKHTAKLTKLAKPKKPKEPPVVPSKKMALDSMKRFKQLALPKQYEVLEKPEWVLTEAMNKHKATDRENKLSKPITRDITALIREFPMEISPALLKFKASKRLKELAQPTARRTNTAATADVKENAFAVSPAALKNKPSKRIKKLAEPKEYENKHIRENPYAISKAALTAKARPRTNQLAQPKKIKAATKT